MNPEDPMIGRTIGQYRIEEEIGRGAMGVVYRARHEQLREDRAIKVLPPRSLASPSARQRLLDEARALARTRHPAVVVLHDFIPTPECDCIVMELVPGSSLDEILKSGPLPEAETVRLGIQLAEGMAAAHTAGVIHRDLKPGNLRVAPDGCLKILDFGLAMRLSADSLAPTAAAGSRSVAGTPPYWAPEIWRGEAASTLSDIFSIGVILREMSTGVRPVPHDEPAPTARRAAGSAAFEAIVRRAMDPDPARRFPSAQELAEALQALRSRSGPAAGGPLRGRATLIRRTLILMGVLLLAMQVPQIREFVRHLLFPRTPIRSVVVLPLENLTGDAGLEYLSDGLTDELIANLAEVPSLRVISRTTAMRYKNSDKSIPTIAQELAVDGVVEGSVKTPGGRVQITVQLFDRSEKRRGRSHRHQADRSAAIEIPRLVAGSLARELGLADNTGPRPAAAQADAGSGRPPDLYWRGRYEWNRRTPHGIRRAIAYFEKAIELDPAFAKAYSGLADAWSATGFTGMDLPANAFPRAKQAALRALELDPRLSEAHVSLANIQQNFDWDWDAADSSFRRAIELDPNNEIAHHWYANHLVLRGDFQRAMTEVRRARELDPYSLPIAVGEAAFLYYARRYDEADMAYQRAAELDSTSWLLQRAMAANLLALGRTADAARAVERWLEALYPGDLHRQAGLAYRRHGMPGVYRVLVAALEAKRAAGGFEPAVHVAELHVLLGERERAFAWLEVAVRERDTELNRLKVDRIFDPLRGDPRFDRMLREVGLAGASARPA